MPSALGSEWDFEKWGFLEGVELGFGDLLVYWEIELEAADFYSRWWC